MSAFHFTFTSFRPYCFTLSSRVIDRIVEGREKHCILRGSFEPRPDTLLLSFAVSHLFSTQSFSFPRHMSVELMCIIQVVAHATNDTRASGKQRLFVLAAPAKCPRQASDMKAKRLLKLN